MSAIWLKALPYIAAVLLALGALYGAYHHGVSTTNATWKAEWNDRDTRDAQAKEQNEAAERAKEQSRQQAINKVVQNGQALIDTAAAAVTAANRESDRLRSAADGLASRIAASQAGGNSCTAAASTAATRAVMVLADVLKKSVRRNTELAETADSAIARGEVCEAAYSALQTK